MIQSAKCKYCEADIIWKEKKPYNPDGSYHKCPNYRKPKHVEPVHVACKQEIEALRMEIDDLRKEIALQKPSIPQNNHDHEQRLKRLEAITVELRRALPFSL